MYLHKPVKYCKSPWDSGLCGDMYVYDRVTENTACWIVMELYRPVVNVSVLYYLQRAIYISKVG
jgi:hypothetical protein